MSQSVWETALATVEPPEQPKGTDLLPQYFDDPLGLCREVFNTDLWGRQREVAEAVIHKPRVGVKSGHKVGKTRLIACLAWWWVLTRPRGLVIATSSINQQVKTQIWREIKKLYVAGGGERRFGVKCPKDPSTGILFDEHRAIYGFTTRDPEGMAGHSSDQLLFIVDEASGFPTEIYEAIQGNMAGGGRVVATGNPTQVTGWFFDAFTHKKHLWSTFTIDSRTTPNCTGEGDPIPGLATPEWVADMVEEYGNGSVEEAMRSPVFAVRVAGQHPQQADNSVVGLSQLESAYQRHQEQAPPPGRLQLGVDPARFGSDDTVIWPGRGHHAYDPTAVHGMDSVEAVTKIKAIIAELSHGGDAGQLKPLVKVDDTGGYGSGIVDTLRRDPSVEVIAVNSSEASEATDRTGQARFTNRRAELWWNLREWLDSAALPRDTKAEAEILAPTYELDPKGRIRIEPKDDIKKRIGRSPDRADALCLLAYKAHTAGGLYAPERSGPSSRLAAPPRVGRRRGAW